MKTVPYVWMRLEAREIFDLLKIVEETEWEEVYPSWTKAHE